MPKKKRVALMEETDLIFRKVWRNYQYYLMPNPSDVSLHQILFLKYLEKRETCTPSDIAKQYGITLGAVTGFVDRLLKLNLITRTRSELDRRLVLIKLSPQGKESLEVYEKERSIKFAQIVEKLDDHRVTELKKALEQFDMALTDLTSESRG